MMIENPHFTTKVDRQVFFISKELNTIAFMLEFVERAICSLEDILELVDSPA
jgi:hypothetical protein